MIDDKRIAELRALCEAASDAPWELVRGPGGHVIENENGDADINTWRPSDAAFIAAARSAVPELLDALAAARAECEKLLAGLVDANTEIVKLASGYESEHAARLAAEAEVDRLRHEIENPFDAGEFAALAKERDGLAVVVAAMAREIARLRNTGDYPVFDADDVIREYEGE